MSEFRSAVRARSLLRGRIFFNNQYSPMECTVRDISATGAKLAFGGPDGIPYEFGLEIPVKRQKFRARLVWRQGSMCGVKFLEE
jgi:PilZ domain